MPKTYLVNEIFYSLQGEGVRAGTANVFVRFAGCNLRCTSEEHGFDCDTDFRHGKKMTGPEIREAIEQVGEGCTNIIFTGGEPALQLDQDLVDLFRRRDGIGWYLAIETNGTKKLPEGLDWICVSPKTPGPYEVGSYIHEFKVVLRAGQLLPEGELPPTNHHVISVPFQSDGTMRKEDFKWCLNLVKQNPAWRLSTQQHKIWGIR